MRKKADNLDFEGATKIREQIKKLLQNKIIWMLNKENSWFNFKFARIFNLLSFSFVIKPLKISI
jgi:hypothetical protein